MLERVAIPLVLIFATVFVHAGCTAGVLGRLSWVAPGISTQREVFARTLRLAGVIFVMTLAAYVEAALWAGFYWWKGEFPSFGEAQYFSLVTFTTLGYGDLTLSEPVRILGAVEAANGIIMFGWTTALIVAVVQRLFSARGPGAADS